MKFVQRTLESPSANLAADEALLDSADATGAEVLRVWESPVPFVVLGYGNHLAAEVEVEVCASRRVPILRRCSGGGTVVQGPGCLNYALCLRVPEHGPFSTVSGTNGFVMERIRAAMAALVPAEVSIQGHTDLALHTGGRRLKFSGNAQRRRRRAVLFHGTILYAFDLAIIRDLLRFPSKQPEYRADRPHFDFVTNITASREEIVRGLKTAWNAKDEIIFWPDKHIQALVTDRYQTDAWNCSR